jgi:dihydroxyacetone kinase
MTQDPLSNESASKKQDALSHTNSEEQYERGTAVDVFATKEEQVAKHSGNDIANSDGSIVSTLDNVFHGSAESMEHNDAQGSNMEGYYKRNETETSDIEEEIDALNKEPKE